MGPELRARAALPLAVLAAVAALVMLTPVLSFGHFVLRLMLRETSLATTAAALLALWFARGMGGRRRRLALGLALPAALLGLLPLLAQLLALRQLGLPFSALEYVAGLRLAPVAEQRDVPLEGSLRADVYRAPGPGPHPFVVVIHGGSWRGGEKGAAAHVSRALATAGWSVFDVEYGLVPDHPFPDAIADVKCLLGRLRARAAELDLDRGRAVLLGRSAGGQIALVAAYSAGDARLPPGCDVADEPVLGVAAFYAPVDLVYGYANPARPDVIHGSESIELYMGGPPSARREAYRLASPRSWADRPLPPTLLVHGESDRLVRPIHSILLASELAAAGVPCRLVRVPFGVHGFDMRPGGVGEQIARGALLGFLRGLAAPGQPPSEPSPRPTTSRRIDPRGVTSSAPWPRIQ